MPAKKASLDISSARGFIMGFAILWVALFHFRTNLSFAPLNQFIYNGFFGVDIFLFLSAFGCVYSYAKKRDFPAFMARRCKRLMPTYYSFLAVFCLYYPLTGQGFLSPQQLFGNITFTGFFLQLGRQTNWYLQTIWVFYLLFPLFFTVIDRARRPALATGLLMLLSVCFIIPFMGGNFDFVVFIARFPIFILGIYFGLRALRRQPVSRLTELIAYLLLVADVPAYLYACAHHMDVLNYTGGRFLLALPAIPGLLFLLSRIHQGLVRLGWGRPIVKVMERMGAASMEMLIVHLFLWKGFFSQMEGLRFRHRLLLLLACCVISILYHNGVDFLVKMLQNKSTSAVSGNQSPDR